MPVVRQKRRGLGADDALLNPAQQLLGLGERQPDLLQLIMRLVEHQNLLVTGAPSPASIRSLISIFMSSPHEFSTIRREESLNHACYARTWISAPGSG